MKKMLVKYYKGRLNSHKNVNLVVGCVGKQYNYLTGFIPQVLSVVSFLLAIPRGNAV